VGEWAAFLAVGDPLLRLDLPESRDRRPAVVTGLFSAAGVLGLGLRAGWRRRVRA
jgi:hypothetical protein